METRRYFGSYVIQRTADDTVPFFVFYAKAKDLLQWVGIRRAADFTEGTQRLLRPARKRAITRFLKANTSNTIPGSILIAFEPSVATFEEYETPLSTCVPIEDLKNNCNAQLTWGFLNFNFETGQPENSRPAMIVDGQHRLYGIAELESEDLPLLVVGLVNAYVQEQAFQFVVINNKAVKVPTDNVKAIIAGIDEEQLQIRLLQAGVSYGDISPILRDINDQAISPFRDLLDWPYNKKGSRLVPLTAIEQALRHIRTLFSFMEDDDDSLVAFFSAIWRSVKASYPELWGDQNKFMTKVNIAALNEYIVERLKHAWEFGLVDVFDPDDVEKQVGRITALLPQEFWVAPWTIKIQDNANVRGLIKEDMSVLAENHRLRRSWFDNLKLVAPND